VILGQEKFNLLYRFPVASYSLCCCEGIGFHMPPVIDLSSFHVAGSEVTLKMYDATHEGLIQSWIDRFQSSDIDVILEELWEKDQKYF
jgi:hypothetical protein